MAQSDTSARVMGGDQRLTLILETAERMFFEKGYRGVSIRDLAAAVGIQMSSLYYYFPSKDDILYRIIKRHIEELLEDATGAIAALPEDATTTQKLETLIRRSVEFLIADRLAAGISTSQARELPVENRREFSRMLRVYENLYLDLIREGMAKGEFIETDAHMASFIILGAQVRLSAWFRPEGRLTAEEVANTYSFLLVRSLAADQGDALRA